MVRGGKSQGYPLPNTLTYYTYILLCKVQTPLYVKMIFLICRQRDEVWKMVFGDGPVRAVITPFLFNSPRPSVTTDIDTTTGRY